VLCVIGIVSQLFDIKKEKPTSLATSYPFETNNVLYNYFPYTDSNKPLFCNNGKLEYSEQKTSDIDTKYIKGTSTATLKGKDEGSIDVNVPTHGYINPYYLKLAFPKSVAFLENKNRVYQGYVLVEFDEEAGLEAVICPMVSSPKPNDKGLSVEEAKGKWPILNESCQPLASIKEIYN
jgi:hypothetical protein